MDQVATVILINNEKKFLLYLRDNKSTIPYPGMWVILGGHLENSETPLQALKRELQEEIEYEIQNPSFIGTFDDHVGNIVHVFKSSINKQLNELVLHEGQKLGFFSFEELIKLEVPEVLKEFFIKNKEKIFK